MPMSSLKGHFLIATPGMSDERFAESVVYLVGHGEDGAMGLIVNHQLETFPPVIFSANWNWGRLKNSSACPSVSATAPC